GKSRKMAAATAARRGTVESVLSCREVSTCRILIIRLVTVATSSSGATIHSTVSSVLRASSTVCWADIVFPQVKLFIKDPTSRFQPSTMTNRRILSGRNHHRRQLQHAHRGGDGCHDHVHHEERQIEGGADLESGFQFRENVGGQHHTHGNVVGPGGARFLG